MDELSGSGLVTYESRIDRAIVGALRGQDLSGFEIWRWLGAEQGMAGLLTEADLYPTLYRLESEHLLESHWREAERIRRQYRLTATALREADARGWPPIVLRGSGPSDAITRPSRTHSPDPDAGSWFVPPKVEPASAAPPSGAAPVPDETDSEDTAQQPPDERSRPRNARLPGSPAIARYVDDLSKSLDLPDPELNRVRDEIADHLADSVRDLEAAGAEAPTAETEAIDHLGDPGDLAVRINRSQHTEARRSRAIQRAVLEFVGEIVLWLVLSAAAFVLAPGAADVVTRLGSLAGLHLTVLRSAEWTTNQMAVVFCVGAFAAGRLSMGHLAQISRHRDATVRRLWAPGGAAVVLAIALLLPGYQDALVIATLLAAPVAFVAGTFRPKHANESAYTWLGLAQAVLVVAAVTLLPSGRVFAYDPNATPGTPLALGRTSVELILVPLPNGTSDYEVPPPEGVGVVTVELWPASTEGLFVVVDRSAAGPTKANAQGVDFTELSPSRPWWVVAVATGPDGQRTALAVTIQAGASPKLGNALGWLISKL